MEKFEKLSRLGEGSYGMVYKCRNRETGELVAIKKFIDEDEGDSNIRKIVLREVKFLKELKHPNLINLLEVFRRKKKIHLVFEYCEGTLLNEIEKVQRDKYRDRRYLGYPIESTRRVIFQVLQALKYCHANNVIHRDIKPENILLTKDGVVKVCDFGFARKVIGTSEDLTDYVATLWYRAPELLVGDPHYGAPVDVWALGCVLAELSSSEPLWPGKTDIDQIYLIKKTIGDLLPQHMLIFRNNKFFQGAQIPEPTSREQLKDRLPSHFPKEGIDFLEKCFDKDPARRWTCEQLLTHDYFKWFNYQPPQRDTLKFANLSGSSSFSSSLNSQNSLPQLASSLNFSHTSFNSMPSPEPKTNTTSFHFPDI